MSPTRLGDHISVLSGFAFDSRCFGPSGDVPIIRIRDVIRGSTETFFSGEYDEKFIIERGDLLIGMDGDFNRALWRSDSALLNQRVCKVSANGISLSQRYLFHILPAILQQIWHSTAFATVKHLSVKTLREVPVALPSLAEQDRIADILDKADALRAKRREAIAHLDALSQSIFHEMFDDPASNLRNWEMAPIGDLATVFSDGPFGSNLKSEHYVESGVRVIRLQNIGVGEFVDNDAAFISEDHFEKLKKHTCIPGDLVIGTLGDPNLRAAVIPPWLGTAINKADCVQMRVDEDLADASYVCALLNNPSTGRMASQLVLGQTRGRISMGRLKGLQVPVPPLDDQKEFANRVATVEHLKAAHRSQLREFDHLFLSLQDRAFKGEL